MKMCLLLSRRNALPIKNKYGFTIIGYNNPFSSCSIKHFCYAKFYNGRFVGFYV